MHPRIQQFIHPGIHLSMHPFIQLWGSLGGTLGEPRGKVGPTTTTTTTTNRPNRLTILFFTRTLRQFYSDFHNVD